MRQYDPRAADARGAARAWGLPVVDPNSKSPCPSLARRANRRVGWSVIRPERMASGTVELGSVILFTTLQGPVNGGAAADLRAWRPTRLEEPPSVSLTAIVPSGALGQDQYADSDHDA